MKLDEKFFAEIAENYGTPLYIYDADEIRTKVNSAKQVFTGLDARIFFALKANSNPHILKLFKDLGINADVVGPVEIESAKRCGMAEMILNGNGKTTSTRDYFLNSGGKLVSMDSLEEIGLWQKSRITKFLRINPDIYAGGHPNISTGGRNHKFGVTPQEAEKVADKLSGLHVHIGSQITTTDPYEAAYSKVIQLSNRLGFSWLDIGGGWGIKYQEDELDPIEFRRRVVPILSNFKGKIVVELGRFLVATAGFLLLRVSEVKRAGKVFVVTDGGMNVLIRPAMYDAWHRISTIGPKGKLGRCDVVGPLCETGDVLAKDREMEIPEPGALLLIENTGAYGFSMASNYNGFPKPAEVMLENGKTKLIRQRETVEDLFRGIPPIL
ncbi:MAG: diaminopimelate decarboxylase [Candidatus Riflebacteria bacterium]|nr:diaminopimelate decarboxylase [Candidatus Riflebacteria bacterium]